METLAWLVRYEPCLRSTSPHYASSSSSLLPHLSKLAFCDPCTRPGLQCASLDRDQSRTCTLVTCSRPISVYLDYLYSKRRTLAKLARPNWKPRGQKMRSAAWPVLDSAGALTATDCVLRQAVVRLAPGFTTTRIWSIECNRSAGSTPQSTCAISLRPRCFTVASTVSVPDSPRELVDT